MSEWKLATSDFDYFQFTVQLQAVDKSDKNNQDKLVAKDVWLTDIVLKDADDNPTITEALRMVCDGFTDWPGQTAALQAKTALHCDEERSLCSASDQRGAAPSRHLPER